MAKAFKMVMTGDKAIDKALLKIAGKQETAKHVNKFMRKATREAVKEIVMPKVKARVPVETGELESSLKVRALKRSRTRLGSGVTLKGGDAPGEFKNPLFSGDTFYGGFLEFGFKQRDGGFYPPDQWLRIPLYTSEQQVKAKVITALKAWIRSAGVKIK